MRINILDSRQRCTVGYQPLVVQGQSFLSILESFGYRGTCGEAPRYIRDNHSVVRIGILVQNDRKFHVSESFL